MYIVLVNHVLCLGHLDHENWCNRLFVQEWSVLHMKLNSTVLHFNGSTIFFNDG
jgi:hypothetical protein